MVTDPREADVGSILGYGYAPYTGGTLSFIEGMGLVAFVRRARELAAQYGPRFEPPTKLVEMAERATRLLHDAGLTVGDLLAELPAVREEIMRDEYGDTFVDALVSAHAALHHNHP